MLTRLNFFRSAAALVLVPPMELDTINGWPVDLELLGEGDVVVASTTRGWDDGARIPDNEHGRSFIFQVRSTYDLRLMGFRWRVRDGGIMERVGWSDPRMPGFPIYLLAGQPLAAVAELRIAGW